MIKLLQAAGVAAMLSAAVALLSLAAALDQIRATAQSLDQQTGATLTHLNTAISHLDDAAAKQSRYWNDVARDTRINLVEANKDLKALRTLLVNADRQVTETGASLRQNSDKMAKVLDAALPAVEEMAKASKNLSDTTSDPNIKATLQETHDAMVQTRQGMEEVNKALADIRGGVHAKLHPSKKAQFASVMILLLRVAGTLF